MLKFSVLRQYLVPQHTYTDLMGLLAECRIPWLKNLLIKIFINRFQVDMGLATIEDYRDYPTFNAFFIRHLKPHLRPIVDRPLQIACPADGCISQIGKIAGDTLFQAKGFYFNLKALLGGDETLAKTFFNGHFATIYLSPKDYHRVHMPYTGTLRETIYIPGKLFSVNRDTTEAVPALFSRNERLVCIFDTAFGPMAVILVGAMIVGNIVTRWEEKPKSKTIVKKTFSDVVIQRGEELGYFNVGSTVILLFPENKIAWNSALSAENSVQMGQLLGVELPK